MITQRTKMDGDVRTAKEFAGRLRRFGGIPEELLDMLRDGQHSFLAPQRGR